MIQPPDRGVTVENKMVNQLIIPTTVPPTYYQVLNTTISTVDEFEERILDSGVSGIYGERKADPYCSEVLNPLTPNPVQVSNGKDIQAVKQIKFQLYYKLSDKSQQEYTYNNLKTGTPLLVGKMADDNCVSILSKHQFNVFKSVKVIIKGFSNPINGLYNIPLARTAELLIP